MAYDLKRTECHKLLRFIYPLGWVIIRTAIFVLYSKVKTDGFTTGRGLISTGSIVGQNEATSKPLEQDEDASMMLDDDCMVELMPFNAVNITEEQLGVMIRNIVVAGRTAVKGLFLETKRATYDVSEIFVQLSLTNILISSFKITHFLNHT